MAVMQGEIDAGYRRRGAISLRPLLGRGNLKMRQFVAEHLKIAGPLSNVITG